MGLAVAVTQFLKVTGIFMLLGIICNYYHLVTGVFRAIFIEMIK